MTVKFTDLDELHTTALRELHSASREVVEMLEEHSVTGTYSDREATLRRWRLEGALYLVATLMGDGEEDQTVRRLHIVEEEEDDD